MGAMFLLTGIWGLREGRGEEGGNLKEGEREGGRERDGRAEEVGMCVCGVYGPCVEGGVGG